MPDIKNKVFKLIGKFQHYAWGGNSFIPQLLRIDNLQKEPFAEYWLGAHNNASAEIITHNSERIKLNEYIQRDPVATLGEYVNQKFRRLPYLLKILDVKDMLSIQVHPSKQEAEDNYRHENRQSVPLGSPQRNYKDDNHKPELMLALGDFWLLHGFKTKERVIDVLNRIPQFNFLIPVFMSESYFGLYKKVMEADQEIVNEVLRPLLESIIPKYLNGELKKDDENFWAARAALTFNEPEKIDRGIFSIYFFNLLNVKAGEAVFQDAGLPHAYLEGQNVEIMANSDNVLRGGLTSKHIDVDELLKHIRFEETIPKIIKKTKDGSGSGVYFSPAVDFELTVIELPVHGKYFQMAFSVQIFIVLQGEVVVAEKGHPPIIIEKGEAFVAFDKALIQIDATQGALLYKAAVPLP